MAGRPHAHCVTERDKEQCVGAILRALDVRGEIALARKQGSMLPDPNNPRTTTPYAAGASVPDSIQTWRLTIMTALKNAIEDLPRGAMYVVIVRATRKPKSSERSFAQIANELGWAEYDARQAHRMMIPFVHKVFVDHVITIDVTDRRPRAVETDDGEPYDEPARELAARVNTIIPPALRIRASNRAIRRLAS